MAGALPLAAALALAERSFAVFPCLPSKAPACPTGFKAASIDPATVRKLWRSWPGSLVGIATGVASGLAVLDIDARNGGADWWAAHRDQLPGTRTIRTRSGGLHLWFRHVAGLRCSANSIARGVDVRAEGGYVIAWHCAGLPVLSDAPLASWPAWLALNVPLRSQRPPEPARVPDDLQIKALLNFVSASPEGERNKRLFWAGCRMAAMVASRLMSEAGAETLLVNTAIVQGLPEIEARKTARSALAAGRIG